MVEYLTIIAPNLISNLEEYIVAIKKTFVMLLASGLVSFVIGLLLGIILIVCREGGILENTKIYRVLDIVINFFRAIPFIILLTWVMPISRFIMGSAIDVKGAIVPLILGCVPFFARQVENALAEVDNGLVEAAIAMGLSEIEIIYRVYLKESVKGLVRNTTLTAISLLGLTAMAGAVGAGGLGDFAIKYGHDRGYGDVTLVTVITVFIIVVIIQSIGSFIIKKNTH